MKNNQVFLQQATLCKTGGFEYAVKAIVRIETKYDNGFLGARIIAVNNYLCGKMVEVVRWLPKMFILKAFKNPQQNHCATVILGSTKKVKIPNDQGFNEEWMLWDIMPESKVEKTFYSTPDWHPCYGR
ncbi:MAG: hypothetical protein HQK52_09405 [Oligoflexia bacterium]|nr:hypothetical protein [Oligoflexia bacterium]